MVAMAEKCRCGKKSVFYRKYEGTRLCKDHFCLSIEKKVKKNIRKYGGLDHGDKISIGLSGDAGSVVLAYIINKNFKSREDLSIFTVSIDEQIKSFSNERLNIAKNLCKKLGMKNYVFPIGKKLADCEKCEAAKQDLLIKKSKELGAIKLFTGHTLEDEIVKMFLDFLKGSALKTDDRKISIPVINPLIDIPEDEIKLYASLKELKFSDKKCPCESNLRYDVRNLLDQTEKRFSGSKFSFMESFRKLENSG